MKTSVRTLAFLIVLIVLTTVPAAVAFAATTAPVGDPSGTRTGTISDVPALAAGQPTLEELGDQVGKNKLGITYVWMLLAGMLIFFFQAGFAMIETGFTQGKNAAHTFAMNIVVFLVGILGYYLVGFAFQYGGIGGVPSLGSGTEVLNGRFSVGNFGLLGYKGFALSAGNVYDVGVFALFFFQIVFMNTACVIPTGAMAERVKFSAVIISAFFMSVILYPVFGNWMWGGGWLSQLGINLGLGHGALDFAGSSVVHAIGGLNALAGAVVLGPRIGKFRKNGSPVAMPGHNIPMAMLGTIVLYFCWFAFNAGSTMNGTDLRISVIGVNTILSGAIGGLTAMFYMWGKHGKPDPSMTCNGVLAGLVAITAPCAYVNTLSALFIGAVAGLLVCISVYVIEYKFKIDDPVGAVSVHAVNGIWGILALGLFADGTYGEGIHGVAGTVKGLLYGDPGQLLAQLTDIGVVIVWGFGLSFVFFKLLNKAWGMRTSANAELEGLDVPEMGSFAYPNFVLSNGAGDDLFAPDLLYREKPKDENLFDNTN